MISQFHKSHQKFLESAFAFNGAKHTTAFVKQWLKEQNEKVHVKVEKIPFSQLEKWEFRNGALRHESGKFFSIEGIQVETNWGPVLSWEQPIINQPEIGYLGFIVKEFNGVLHFLMQAKIEPGNINYVQLSPTIQATKSNYTRVHEGKSPLYLEYFVNTPSDEVWVDQLQSEQGARFLKKRNRNIIIHVNEDIPEYENFIWLTLAQIKELAQYDNLVNMDTRTVISGITFGNFDVDSCIHSHQLSGIESAFLKSAYNNENELNSFDYILRFVTRHKAGYDLSITSVALDKVKNWQQDAYKIHHAENKYFNVIAVRVEIGNREVVQWTQPMIEPAQEGICAFVCKEINGILHFVVQAKMECGNFDVIEFAPTVQCLTGNYNNENSLKTLPFLDYVLKADTKQIIFDTHQSEEGGRFYREQNRNVMVLAGDEIPVELPEHFIWMTLQQLQTFIRFNNYINVQARSLISAIRFKHES